MKKLIFLLIALTVIYTDASGQSDRAKRSLTPGLGKNYFNKNRQIVNNSSPAKISIKFLKWYVYNQGRLRHHLFNVDTTGDTTKLITVNFDNVRQYEKALKKSGYVSDKFLVDFLTKFHYASNYLSVHPVTDGPLVDIELKDRFSIDFSIDPVLQIMEEDMLTDYIKTIKLGKNIVNKTFSVVTVKVSRYLDYVFVLSKKKDKWLIDSILPQL